MPVLLALTRRVWLDRFLRGMGNARKFDALHARDGYTLLLKFDLDAPPKLSRDLILPCRRGPHLQSHRRRIAVKVLHAKNPHLFHNIEETCKRLEAWREKRAPGSTAAMRQMMGQAKPGTKGT